MREKFLRRSNPLANNTVGENIRDVGSWSCHMKASLLGQRRKMRRVVVRSGTNAERAPSGDASAPAGNSISTSVRVSRAFGETRQHLVDFNGSDMRLPGSPSLVASNSEVDVAEYVILRCSPSHWGTLGEGSPQLTHAAAAAVWQRANTSASCSQASLTKSTGHLCADQSD